MGREFAGHPSNRGPGTGVGIDTSRRSPSLGQAVLPVCSISIQKRGASVRQKNGGLADPTIRNERAGNRYDGIIGSRPSSGQARAQDHQRTRSICGDTGWTYSGLFGNTKVMMEHFWKACDAPGPLVLDVERSDAPGVERYTLAQPFAMLGRDPRSDIPLTHDDVSRRHLFLHVIGGSLHALDLGSRTGTRWAEGARHSGWLLPGQSLRVGPFTIRCMSVGRGAPPEVGSNLAAGPLESTPPDLEQASLWPRLALVYGAGPKRKTWRMKRVATLVGSGIGCGPRLADPSVSSRHCALLHPPRPLRSTCSVGVDSHPNGSIAALAPPATSCGSANARSLSGANRQ